MFTIIITSEHKPAPTIYNTALLTAAKAIGRPSYGEKSFIYDEHNKLVETFTNIPNIY